MITGFLLFIAGFFFISVSESKSTFSNVVVFSFIRKQLKPFVETFSKYIGISFLALGVFIFFNLGFSSIVPSSLFLMTGLRFNLEILDYFKFPKDLEKMERIKYGIGNFYKDQSLTLGILNLIMSLVYFF